MNPPFLPPNTTPETVQVDNSAITQGGGRAGRETRRARTFRRDGRKAKHSAWFITINTNRYPRDVDTGSFHQALLDMVSEEGLEAILDFAGSEPDDTPHALSTHLARSSARVVTEIGNHPKGGRVHGHVMLATRHFSRIRLTRGGIVDFLIRRIDATPPLRNLYVNWRLVGVTNLYRIEDYMEKYMPIN
jgi:hypothetical protein